MKAKEVLPCPHCGGEMLPVCDLIGKNLGDEKPMWQHLLGNSHCINWMRIVAEGDVDAWNRRWYQPSTLHDLGSN
jgi:hypothetical protein